jgi:hypothetical protein
METDIKLGRFPCAPDLLGQACLIDIPAFMRKESCWLVLKATDQRRRLGRKKLGQLGPLNSRTTVVFP